MADNEEISVEAQAAVVSTARDCGVRDKAQALKLCEVVTGIYTGTLVVMPVEMLGR